MRGYTIANSILWATAILVSAILGAPKSLTLIFLPSLATLSGLLLIPAARRRDCRI